MTTRSLVGANGKLRKNSQLGFFTYEYDFVGHLSAQILNGVRLAAFRKKKSRRTHFTAADNGSTDNTYTYDANGNRSDENYDVGSGNRLAADATWNYFYDNEGNLIKRVNITEGEDAGITWTYAYDNANHLIQAKEWDSDPDVHEDATLLLQANYTYDVFGNRIEKSVDWDGAGEDDPVITKFAYDGWNNVKSSSPVGNENWDVIADLDDAGSLITRYVRGDAADQLFASIASDGDTLWNLTDQLGSVRDVIDNNGAIKDQITYDAFGNFTESDPEFGGRYKWTNREFDAETGFQFNRARYYDAETGRWISQDPLGFDAGDSNLYRYVNNRPTIATDPSGYLEADDNPQDPEIKNLKDVRVVVEKFITSAIRKVHLAFPADTDKAMNRLFLDLGKALTFTRSKVGEDVRKLLTNMQENKAVGPFIVTKALANTRYKNVPLAGVLLPGQFNLDKVPLAFQNVLTASALLGEVINMDGVPIGMDKLEHFFEEGYTYLQIFKSDPANSNGRYRYGQYLEGDPHLVGIKGDPQFPTKLPLVERDLFQKWTAQYVEVDLKKAPFIGDLIGKPGIFGWRSSGVVSYADIVANEWGFQFYMKMSQSWNALDPDTFQFHFKDYMSGGSFGQLNEYTNPNLFHPYLRPHVTGPQTT